MAQLAEVDERLKRAARTGELFPGVSVGKDRESTPEAKRLLEEACRELVDADIFEVSSPMVADVHRVSKVRRSGFPVIQPYNMPSGSGYVFFDTRWPESIVGVRPRSITWSRCKLQHKDEAEEALLVILLAHGVEKMYAEILPLGEDKVDEAYQSSRRGLMPTARLIWSLWMMVNSELAATRKVRYDKRRVPRPLRNVSHGEIHVVTLRRRRLDGEIQHRDVDWQCSWDVKAHYRHLEKYAPITHHRATPSRDDRGLCYICGKRITLIGTYTKDPAGLGTSAKKGVQPTIQKLVR